MKNAPGENARTARTYPETMSYVRYMFVSARAYAAQRSKGHSCLTAGEKLAEYYKDGRFDQARTIVLLSSTHPLPTSLLAVE